MLWRRTLRYIIKVFCPFSRNMRCMTYTIWDPVFCKVHCQSLFCGFSAKEKQADYFRKFLLTRPPTRNHKGKCVFCTTRVNQVKQLLGLLRFSVYSVLLFVQFFSSSATFRWGAVVNRPETNHSTSLPQSRLVLLDGDHPNHGCPIEGARYAETSCSISNLCTFLKISTERSWSW